MPAKSVNHRRPPSTRQAAKVSVDCGAPAVVVRMVGHGGGGSVVVWVVLHGGSGRLLRSLTPRSLV